MNAYQIDKNDLARQLHTSTVNGLTNEQVEEIRRTEGWNELQEQKRQSLVIRFLLQFKDPLILVLIAAAIISVSVDPSDWIDSLIICVVVVLNAFLGVYQENNAEKSLDALKKMSAPNAKVIRGGIIQTIPSRELVPGDLVSLDAGDYVPSDGRIIESYNLQIDESALTGESVPVLKMEQVIQQDDVALGDRKNCAFSTTMVTYGRGRMIVTSTGMENEVGRIAGMLMQKDDQTTPLQIKLAQISKVIGIMCLVICAVVFFMEYSTGLDMLDAFKTAVALAVAAIPEGLATVVTIVLSLGVTRMVKQNAIVRKLPAVETLGSASVVCSDKTGTLTQNKMTVVKTYTEKTGLKDFSTDEDESIRSMLRDFTLCTDAEVKEVEGKRILIGDPTEIAMVEASIKLGDTKESLLQEYSRQNEIAFDSERKMMTVFYETSQGIYSYTKGAPDQILARCSKQYPEALKANEEMAEQALRVLAVARRKWKSIPVMMQDTDIEKDMEFVGLIGMIDPPRMEVKDAVEQAKEGGIRTIMITGDHVTTASAIAKQLGIMEDGNKAITGLELDKMDDDTLSREIENIAVYARVAPEHKVRIVKMWQKKGKVVAMTGDGVNDSPALKAADIGCAMGITGTDVSKNAADMILTDDNFATIIKAVKEGRGIYANIKKDVQFLLSSNIGEVVTIFGASLLSVLGWKCGVPLMPVHLLWINLITDTLPAFALGMETADDDIMKQKPRPKDESFFANGLGFTICWQGLLIGTTVLAAYLLGNGVSHELGMTMAFFTLSTTELLHAFSIKSQHSVFSRQVFSNKYLWYSLLIGLTLQFTVMYVPFFNEIFTLVPLSIDYLFICIGMAFIPVAVVEITKLFAYIRHKA